MTVIAGPSLGVVDDDPAESGDDGVAPDECLSCYLERVVETIGCHGDHSLMRTWIAAQPDRPKWVLMWATTFGGYCDCEVLFNATPRAPDEPKFTKVVCAQARAAMASYEYDADEEEDEYDLE